jgi:hypothetical protein
VNLYHTVQSIMALLMAVPRAVGLLNGGGFNDRCIIASDRNKSESIKIKERVDTSPAGGHLGAYSTAYYYEGPLNSSRSAVFSGHYWGSFLPYHGSAEWPKNNGFLNTAASETANGGDCIRTEQHELLIQGLPFRARPYQVIAWVREMTGDHASNITTINVPQMRSGSELCGHAHLTSGSSWSANEAVRLLVQSTFKGQQVSVQMASGGVTLFDRPQETTGRDMNKDKKAKKSNKRGKGKIKTAKDESGGNPLVVDGRTQWARMKMDG